MTVQGVMISAKRIDAPENGALGDGKTMLADLVKNVFGEKRFKFHRTDPTTDKRETVELGSEG